MGIVAGAILWWVVVPALKKGAPERRRKRELRKLRKQIAAQGRMMDNLSSFREGMAPGAWEGMQDHLSALILREAELVGRR